MFEICLWPDHVSHCVCTYEGLIFSYHDDYTLEFYDKPVLGNTKYKQYTLANVKYFCIYA